MLLDFTFDKLALYKALIDAVGIKLQLTLCSINVSTDEDYQTAELAKDFVQVMFGWLSCNSSDILHDRKGINILFPHRKCKSSTANLSLL